ncbi:hypothetical protein [Ruegeria sp. HKCCA5426]|uniref:hypothetical protein n=1 Tax=Ruegeria sp. HKCCA5426 TaxID=2682985 RepID=UPI001488EFAE|nr:hypothetical protein [Ruegeria sp. HKCCA5426]
MLQAALKLVFVFAFFLLSSIQSVSANPLGLRPDERNASIKPTTKNGETTFGLRYGECSSRSYSGDRTENDCKNGNIRSSLKKKWVRVGSTVRYSFDFWVDPSIAYAGWKNSNAKGFLPGAWDTRLRIAAWLGDGKHNYLYLLKLDKRYGVRFVGKTCASPSDFGKWIPFEMTVKWSRTNDGTMTVKCNGKVIYHVSGKPTTVSTPHCYITNLCNPKLNNNPGQIGFEMGLVMQGFGPDWQRWGYSTPFTPFNGSIVAKFRNVKMKRVRIN